MVTRQTPTISGVDCDSILINFGERASSTQNKFVVNEGVAVGSRIRRWRGSLFGGRLRYSRMCSCCGSAVDAASDFLFDDAVSLIVLARPRVAFLRLVETVTAGRPRGGATGLRPWSFGVFCVERDEILKTTWEV